MRGTGHDRQLGYVALGSLMVRSSCGHQNHAWGKLTIGTEDAYGSRYPNYRDHGHVTDSV
jgi:hypothetical protein